MSNFTYGNDTPAPLTVQLSGLRKKISSLLSTQDQNASFHREAYHYLANAKMMLGNLLKELGEDSPYREAAIKRAKGESDEIPEEDDVPDTITDLPEDRVKRIDAIRSIISELIVEVKSTGDQVNDHFVRSRYPGSEYQSRWVSCVYERSVQELMLARNWFGKSLGRIRDKRKMESK